jgi:hypothetical protein
MSLKVLYRSARTDGARGEPARQLLDQTHWFTVNAEFDPKTGDALPQALSEFLAKVAEPKPNGRTQDRLYRITEHTRPAVERLLRTLNESPRREHAILPVRAVRELDAGSFIRLSARPGRNIREKLAGKPYLQAVRRFQSVNLPENRLLKSCVSRLAELLRLRSDVLGESEDALLPRIDSWLSSDEARAVGTWDNLPPNNALLAHRDYRRVWDAWRRLQSLDDDIALDLLRLDARSYTMRRWIDYGRMYREGTHLFADMPVLFDYEEFTIRTWSPEPECQRAARRIGRSTRKRAIETAACLDLAALRPRFANVAGGSQELTETYLWQQWKNTADTVDIALFACDAACLHPDARTVTSQDLFFDGDRIDDHLLERAARAFADRLRTIFKNDKLIWLVPDALNDFELEVVRRNLNARFPGAGPLPRSIAALFEQIDYARITNDGYPVVVVDTIGGIACATRMVAMFDADLKKRLPETNGYYWGRCPPVMLSKRDTGEDLRYGMVTVDSNGAWHSSPPPERPQFIDPRVLKDDKRIGPFAFCINVSNSPVAGGMRLHALQALAGDIPLWQDQIPELSIKVMKDGRPHRFYLVSRGITVKPVRGLSVQIPIEERFTLPAGRRFYQFPLSQGEKAAELRFSARLDSSAFPLKSKTACELILTFQYGDDEPYTLTFAPLDGSFPPVRVSWQRTVEEIVTNAPAPEYPAALSWDDLRRWRDPQGNEVDLLAWNIESLKRLIELTPRRLRISISSSWKARRDSTGTEYWFAFATTEDGQRCYCNTKHLVAPVDGDPNAVFPLETELYASIRQTPGGLAAFDISPEHAVHYSVDANRRLLSFRERSLQNRMATIWADGRSVTDAGCPEAFKRDVETLITTLMDSLPSDILDRKMMFLLACLHKDTVDSCVTWVTGQVESGHIREPRAVGLALGDVSQKWQQYVFDRLASHPRNDAISVLAYAIWRERDFVKHFSLSALIALLHAMLQRLARVSPPRRVNDQDTDRWAIRNWARATVEPLELLLGLLRTRASDDPDIRMLLQPHQRITKQFAEQIDRLEEMSAETHVSLFSRVQINIQKPEGVRSPDLLYALRLYLTGDDGANAIHITGISDTDDD